MRSSVDLPQPDGPTSTMNSPSSIVRLTSSTAVTLPANSFVMCSSLIAATPQYPARMVPITSTCALNADSSLAR